MVRGFFHPDRNSRVSASTCRRQLRGRTDRHIMGGSKMIDSLACGSMRKHRIFMCFVFAAGMFLCAGVSAQSNIGDNTSFHRGSLEVSLTDTANGISLLAQHTPTKPEFQRAPAVEGLVSQVESRIAGARDRFKSIAAGPSALPTDLKRIINMIREEVAHHGVRILPLVILFMTLGLGAQWGVRFSARHFIDQLDPKPSLTVADRLRAIRLLFLVGLLELVALGVASIGAFIVLEWPPLVRMIVLSFLVAFLCFRAVELAARTILQPHEHPTSNSLSFRIMPIDNARAAFWYRRVLWLAGLAFSGLVTTELLMRLGSSFASIDFVVALFGTFILAITIESLLSVPDDATTRTAKQRQTRSLLLTGYFILLWLLWLGGLRFLFLLGVALIAVPAVFSIIDRCTAHVLRPIGADDQRNARYIAAIAVAQRALRAVVLIGTALYLHRIARAQFPDEAASRFILQTADMLLNAVIAFALFDFFWRLTRAYIDKKILDFRQDGVPADEQAVRRHRIGTILPILRNFVFILTATIVTLMYMSSIGVAILPLLAGASVFGVAIAFGSQTLVKDVLSGIFYLLDDAFRIGEYIQSGSYMGTVEGFTLRSIRLRHHRGPVFTVPFGSLGAIQNMSRDWALDKIVLGVTYDADITKAKKLIKQVGQELLENAEFAPNIIETLKMQGVDELGDFAVKIKLKMMTRPGEQAPIRRWALARIKTLFDENGINFAFPTVTVAEGRPTPAAGVIHALPKPKSSPT